MSATFFANELTSLVSEAKRRNNDLRQAAEKALQELNGLSVSSEQQLAADLSRRSAFIDPFLIACGTRNPKYCSSALNCLQRLITIQGLPTTRLQDALQAFDSCTNLGLDVQLKILQALPSLLQNYGDELQGELLGTALSVCSSLQNAKAATVSGVATATLQQLVNSVFDKIVEEDEKLDDVPVVAEIPGEDAPVKLRPAAYDAYRLFRDLALTTDNRKAKFVELAASPNSCLELIHTAIDAHAALFATHDELCEVISSNILPAIIRALSEKLSFQTTVRSVRILGLILRRYLHRFAGECEVALGLVTHMLDQDAAPPWKRVLMMETVRQMFAESSLVVEMYALYDGAESGKSVVQDMLSSFVRLSSEKPAAIGLGQQSSLPIGSPTQRDARSDFSAMEAASGMAGVISSALGVSEASVAGISAHWSMPRVAFMDLLDKVDPPTPPETYIYSLVLDCLNNLADSLAKIVLPMATHRESSHVKQPTEDVQAENNGRPASRRTRSHSFQQRTIPLDPLTLVNDPRHERVRAVAGIVENCWPALLATSSTFLNAALDDQYFKTLVKAYQRFTQVCGLLRHTTSRDALLTTLAKSAIPPNVLSSAFAEQNKSTEGTDSPRVFSNPRNMLSVDSLVGQASSLSFDREARPSVEPSRPQLTARNLLCLRALLNLAIALGPVLDTAFTVIVDSLRQADIILSNTGPQQMARENRAGSVANKGSNANAAILQAFSNEVSAVEAAASRLLESTQDYPDDAFVNVLQAFCQLLHSGAQTSVKSPTGTRSPQPIKPGSRRTSSGLPSLATSTKVQPRDYQFVLPKLGHLAELNIARFTASEGGASGWDLLVQELLEIATSRMLAKKARVAASDVLCKLSSETVLDVSEDEEEHRAVVQRRALSVLMSMVHGIYSSDSTLSSCDLQIHSQALDALRGILEHSGDSLLAGWNKIIALLSSVFEVEHWTEAHPSDTNQRTRIDWEHIGDEFVSINLGRVGFAATQLLCSEFLAPLPAATCSSLIELLRRFMGQEEDLNIALTAISMAWTTSDFLMSQTIEGPVDQLHSVLGTAKEPDTTSTVNSADSRQAQWLLVLVKLRDVVNESPREIQNAAFRTLCAILDSHGQRLSTSSWELVLRNMVLQILCEDAEHIASLQRSEQVRKNIDTATSAALMRGCSDVLVQQLQSAEHSANIARVWPIFLSALGKYLESDVLAVATSVWRALTTVLSNTSSTSSGWHDMLSQADTFWQGWRPSGVGERESERDNQSAYLAYIDAAGELCRLKDFKIDQEQVATVFAKLEECITTSDGPSHGADVNRLSPLQAKVMGVVKKFDTSQSEIPNELVAFAAKMVMVCRKQDAVEISNVGPTFIALSATAIAWLQELIPAHESIGIWSADSVRQALDAFANLMESKYAFQAESNGQALWRAATVAAVDLSKQLLGHPDRSLRDVSTSQELDAVTGNWTAYVRIACAIMDADTSLQPDEAKIYNDVLFDIDMFQKLRNMLIPGLGDFELQVNLVRTYSRSLFDASNIHRTEKGEVPPPGSSPLGSLSTIRRGRVKPIPYSPREDMCYVCLKELITLTEMHGTSFASAAAPLLVLRLAIPIRAYIADQPLRGTWPQPLSELEELLFCFEAIRDLDCSGYALGINYRDGGKQNVQRAHLLYLQPLLARAVGTAGDRWSGAEEVLKPLQAVLQAIAEKEKFW